MRAKKEVVEELRKRINSGEPQPNIEDILLDDGERILVRSMTAEKIGSETYISIRYEIWSDKNKYLEGIPAEGNKIYCSGYAGPSEEDMINLFQSTSSSLSR